MTVIVVRASEIESSYPGLNGMLDGQSHVYSSISRLMLFSIVCFSVFQIIKDIPLQRESCLAILTNHEKGVLKKIHFLKQKSC